MQQDTFEAMRIKEFRNLMFGRFLFIMALRMMAALVGYWMYELTGNPLAIGLIGLVEVIPAVSLSLHAGYKIDISEKRKLLLTGVVLYLLAAILLLTLSTHFAAQQVSKHFIITSIYIIIFFTGIFRSFTGPSFGTLLALIVPKEILSNGISWSQGAWLSASVFGHALVGFLIAGFGIEGALMVIVILVICGFFFMYKIKPHPPVFDKKHVNTWDNITEGLKYVYKTKELLGALSLDLFAVLFGGAVAMIPVFAKDILHTGPIGYGWLNAATDLGAIICIVTILKYPLKTNQGKKLLFSVAGFGLCMIIFAISKIFWLSFLALLISGILDGVSVVVRGTITQLKTPDEMRGRVMSISSMFVNSSNELGQFESGVAARYMGNVVSVVFGGCVTIGVATYTWLKIPRLKNLKY